MDLGFVIDHRKCIGCHACTVACKAENDVPVGSFRTWVKYVEKGVYPDTRRHFTVLRCNHCDAAPCVTICPVNALEKRPDKIVDLDRDRCIGCRACMQACPYDALYLNEDTGVAEKCHFCAHRTSRGLEPACVVVCPERAIVAGDTSNPESEISRYLADGATARRKVEKGTEPRVWYVAAEEEGLRGGRAAEPERWIWSDRAAPPPPLSPAVAADGGATTVLNADHPAPWGAHVWAYLVTKNVAAGAMLVAPFLAFLGVERSVAASVLPEALALLFLGVTQALLVHDLGRPERFLRVLTTPNPSSWLVKGAWVLVGFGAVTTASFAARLLGFGTASDLLRIADLPLAVLASGYSAWLFHQCRGRDFWHEDKLFLQLVLRAATFGAALPLVLPRDPALVPLTAAIFLLLAGLNGGRLLASRAHPPATEDGRKAHAIFWASGDPQLAAGTFLLAVAIAAPMLLGVDAPGLGGVAIVLGAVATVLYEKAWIDAGQAVPLS